MKTQPVDGTEKVQQKAIRHPYLWYYRGTGGVWVKGLAAEPMHTVGAWLQNYFGGRR